MINKSNIEDIYGLTNMQEGMLFHWLQNPKAEAYYEQVTLTIGKQVNAELMKLSIERLIMDNPILRTVFYFKGLSKPRQIVMKKSMNSLSITNGTQKDLYEYQITDRNRKFDLENEEPVRFKLIEDSENNKSYFVFSFHHIILDGWSLGLILSEIIDNYFQLIKNGTIKTRKVTKFSNYIKWYETIKNDKAAKEFWCNYLEGYDSNSEMPNFGLSGKEDCEEIFITDKLLSEQIESFCKNNQITESIFFSTILGILVQKYNNSEDAIISEISSGRNAPIYDIENIKGILIQNRIIRVRNNTSIIDLMKNQQTEFYEGEKYNYIGISELQNILGKPINIIYTFENFP